MYNGVIKNEHNQKNAPEFYTYIESEGATINYPLLSLSAEDPSRRLVITIAKMPIKMETGKSYAHRDVFVDNEAQKLDLVSQARNFSSFQEKERVRLLVNLLKKNLHLATQDNINKLKLTDPETADWVEETVSENTLKRNVPLTEIIKHKYGICTHHSAIYLWLAQEAGLKGAIMRSTQNTIKNIIRSDNQQLLFKSTGEGNPVSSHVWVEILLESGEWMPVDPTTGLVGDNHENLKMFEQANYICDIFDSSIIKYQIEPADKINLRVKHVSAPAGHKSGNFSIELNLASTQEKRITSLLKKPPQVIPPTNEPYSGEAVLSVQTPDLGDVTFKIIEVSE